ncbi:MAG: ABC transporter permease subunit [Blastocatellia bacterium]
MRLLSALWRKEWRELLASRAYWLLLLVIGPLVGNDFIHAVNLFAEASGSNGGAAALPQELTPLDGIFVPTWGAYDLAITLLFPFVAIRLLSAEKESGALKLAQQFPAGRSTMMLAKVLALIVGWAIAWFAGVLALVLWKSYGGHSYAPEALNLLAGHWLRMLLSAGFALAAAAIAESAASAAILTLSFTLGTWALDFIANGRGGWLAEVAAYTPTSALRFFEQGLLRLNTTLALLALAFVGFALAALWIETGRKVSTRLLQTAGVLLLAVVVVLAAAQARSSWDVSENRRNSFSRTDEATLRQIQQPLGITINLAAEDPRLMDYERGILNKLRRLLPNLHVTFAANSRTGLFEGSDEHYGEIWYEWNGQKVMNRSTTEPIVLEQLYQLTQLAPPTATEEAAFPGYPLAVEPRGARLIFYGLWPLAVLACWWFVQRHRR